MLFLVEWKRKAKKPHQRRLLLRKNKNSDLSGTKQQVGESCHFIHFYTLIFNRYTRRQLFCSRWFNNMGQSFSFDSLSVRNLSIHVINCYVKIEDDLLSLLLFKVDALWYTFIFIRKLAEAFIKLAVTLRYKVTHCMKVWFLLMLI